MLPVTKGLSAYLHAGNLKDSKAFRVRPGMTKPNVATVDVGSGADKARVRVMRCDSSTGFESVTACSGYCTIISVERVVSGAGHTVQSHTWVWLHDAYCTFALLG